MQSVHNSALMMKMSSPSLIAPSGHSGSQAPQEMQSSVILCAMRISFTKDKSWANYNYFFLVYQVNDHIEIRFQISKKRAVNGLLIKHHNLLFICDLCDDTYMRFSIHKSFINIIARFEEF
jgi:hypothetical protein